MVREGVREGVCGMPPALPSPSPFSRSRGCQEREFFIDNLLVRIHFIIVMIRWNGLAPWEFGFPFPPGSLTSTFLVRLSIERTIALGPVLAAALTHQAQACPNKFV